MLRCVCRKAGQAWHELLAIRQLLHGRQLQDLQRDYACITHTTAVLKSVYAEQRILAVRYG